MYNACKKAFVRFPGGHGRRGVVDGQRGLFSLNAYVQWCVSNFASIDIDTELMPSYVSGLPSSGRGGLRKSVAALFTLF